MRGINPLTFALAICLLPASVPRTGHAQTSEIDCDRLAGLPGDKNLRPGIAGTPFDRIDSRQAEDACRAALRSDSSNPRLLFQLGRALLSGKNAEGVRYYKEAADRRYATAMDQLAEFYEKGLFGVTKNLVTAVDLYRKAAELGSVDAMHKIGQIYDDGVGVPQNFATAKSWYEKSAERGSAPAMNNLGMLYMNGKVGPKDYNLAKSWYEKADVAGSRRAQANLGIMYASGRGVPKNFDIAKQWFEKGAALGDPNAANMLGELYENGNGVNEDYIGAKAWYEKAASWGSKEAPENIRRINLRLSNPAALYLHCELAKKRYRVYIDDPQNYKKHFVQRWDNNKWDNDDLPNVEITDVKIRFYWKSELPRGSLHQDISIDRTNGDAASRFVGWGEETGLKVLSNEKGKCKKTSPFAIERKF